MLPGVLRPAVLEAKGDEVVKHPLVLLGLDPTAKLGKSLGRDYSPDPNGSTQWLWKLSVKWLE